MKKNEAPERIWLAIDRGAVWTTNPDSKKYIEYIRIDAFTEKACEWLRSNFNMPDGFEKHLIKAMKGEI